MSALGHTASFRTSSNLSGGMRRFADEVLELLSALSSPAKIIGEVQQMRALQVEASRIEASDPTGAAALRQRAARIGLR